jgi:hypothetical protein
MNQIWSERFNSNRRPSNARRSASNEKEAKNSLQILEIDWILGQAPAKEKCEFSLVVFIPREKFLNSY